VCKVVFWLNGHDGRSLSFDDELLRNIMSISRGDENSEPLLLLYNLELLNSLSDLEINDAFNKDNDSQCNTGNCRRNRRVFLPSWRYLRNTLIRSTPVPIWALPCHTNRLFCAIYTIFKGSFCVSCTTPPLRSEITASSG
jgi:hypothetical protein